MQAADRVDIATVFAADEDFELRINRASVFDERADHLLDCRVDGDERMTLEEFLVDVERQEAVGVVAGNGECRLGEVVGTEGSEAIDGVNVIVEAGDFGAEGGNDFAAGDGGCRGFDHRAECVRNCEALFFLDLGGNLDGDFENGLDFGGDDDERDFDFGFRMFASLMSSATASKTALICISGISGLVMAIRTERWPSIGFSSCFRPLLCGKNS